jgi:signal transduction histidine kinase
METLPRLQPPVLSSRRLPVLVVGLTLAVFAAVIYLGALQLRKSLRAQIAGRDAEILYAVALMQQLSDNEGTELGGEIEHVADQLNVILEISKLKGVIAARLFDGQGKFTLAFPAHVSETNLSSEQLPDLTLLKPGSRFYPQASVDAFFTVGNPGAPRIAPLLEVNIPLHRLHRKDQPRLLAVAQFIMDGEAIAKEFAALDRSLLIQGGAVFVAGGLIIAVALAWAFRRLQKAGRVVFERTEKLLRANEELALAAKTSAVGAVTAHLIHRLSNPLSGLREFVASRGDENDADWSEAAATAREMQNLVAEIIRLLGEEQTLDRYEISFAELGQIIIGRVQTVADQAGVRFTSTVTTEGVLPNREASLAGLILENLVRNAIEATPSGKEVSLAITCADGNLVCEVRDEGDGIPESLRANLFVPCRSRKAGGHGIGLAICKQLAGHAGAILELKSTGVSGSVFALRLAMPVAEEPLLVSDRRAS